MQHITIDARSGIIIHTYRTAITSPIKHDSAFQGSVTNSLSSESDLFAPDPLCTAVVAIPKCWLLVLYIYRSARAVRGSGLKGVPLVIIIWACLFSLWSLWCGKDCSLHEGALAARLLSLTRVTLDG